MFEGIYSRTAEHICPMTYFINTCILLMVSHSQNTKDYNLGDGIMFTVFLNTKHEHLAQLRFMIYLKL